MATTRPTPDAPAAERPRGSEDADGKILLVMDATCAVCAWGARLIARRDVDDQFRILPAQTPRGKALLESNGLDAEDPDSWIVVAPSGVLTEADAVIAVGRRLNGVWPILARIGGLPPRSFRNWAYRRLAKNRYRLFGRADLCAMPNEAVRRRLLSG